MRANEWKRLATELVEPFRPALTLTGSLIHAPGTTTILRGLAKDSSGFSTDFAVWAFVQPLGVPVDHMFFSYGRRLRRHVLDDLASARLLVNDLRHAGGRRL